MSQEVHKPKVKLTVRLEAEDGRVEQLEIARQDVILSVLQDSGLLDQSFMQILGCTPDSFSGSASVVESVKE